MLLSILLIAIISLGAFGLTYLMSEDRPLMLRLAYGWVIGSAIFGTAGFLAATIFGMTTVAVLIAFAVVLIPLIVFLDPVRRKKLNHDIAKAKGKIVGINQKKALRFAYYVFFAVLFVMFFDKAMMFVNEEIFTGGSNNLGDLPYHLGAINAFLNVPAFPPDNPNFAGAKFTYPFIADLMTAMFVKLGIGVREAMLVQNSAWAFSLLVILENFVFTLSRNKLASKIAPFLFLFAGGLGFIWFFSDFAAQAKGFFTFINELPKDYTIGNDYRWGNPLTTLFLTQRSLLLGLPISLIVIGGLWNIFRSNEVSDKNEEAGDRTQTSNYRTSLPELMILGGIAGSLALIHIHSLIVLFIITAILMIIRFDKTKWISYIIFGTSVAIVALPELIWSMSGSASRTSEFIGWHFGWDNKTDNVIWFWLKNTGLLIPLMAAGIYLVRSLIKPESKPAVEVVGPVNLKTEKKIKKAKNGAINEPQMPVQPMSLLLFYIPFLFLFVLSNTVKLAPWEWDNIKILVYWFVGSLPFASLALAWLWQSAGTQWYLKAGAAALIAVCVFSGVLDVWRTVSGQVNYKVFDKDAVIVANRIKASTKPDSMFLNAPTFNTAVVLSGRNSLMRYGGHLFSHGIDFRPREADLREIYRGGPQAEALMRQYKITHVLISPEERNTVSPNEMFFAKYPVVAESGQYKVYKVSE